MTRNRTLDTKRIREASLVVLAITALSKNNKELYPNIVLRNLLNDILYKLSLYKLRAYLVRL